MTAPTDRIYPVAPPVTLRKAAWVVLAITLAINVASMAVPALIDHPLTTNRGEIQLYLDVFMEGNLPTWWSTGLLVVAAVSHLIVGAAGRSARVNGTADDSRVNGTADDCGRCRPPGACVETRGACAETCLEPPRPPRARLQLRNDGDPGRSSTQARPTRTNGPFVRSSWAWFASAAMLGVLSLDDHTQLHERLDRIGRELVTYDSGFPFYWLIPGLIAGAVLATGLMLLARQLHGRARWYVIIGCALLLASALGMESLQGLLIAAGESGPVYVLTYHAEELGENLGVLLMMAAAAKSVRITRGPHSFELTYTRSADLR